LDKIEHFETGSTLIFFFGGRQSQFENHHKGKNNDPDESQPTDDFQGGGIADAGIYCSYT
jgi:hypothetical protein